MVAVNGLRLFSMGGETMKDVLDNPYVTWIITGVVGSLCGAVVFFFKRGLDKAEKRLEKQESQTRELEEKLNKTISDMPFLYTLRDAVAENPDFIRQNERDLCASLLHTVVDILVDKLIRAAKEYGIKDIAIGGGVSANSVLRSRIAAEGEKRGWRTFIPELKFTTDNAAMIAVAGYFKYCKGEFSTLDAAPIARYEDLL